MHLVKINERQSRVAQPTLAWNAASPELSVSIVLNVRPDTHSTDAVLAYVESPRLAVGWILDAHPDAAGGRACVHQDDYHPGGRRPRVKSTVQAQKHGNVHLANMDEQAFVAMRKARARTLPMPQLFLHTQEGTGW